jgi:hypothetical protein
MDQPLPKVDSKISYSDRSNGTVSTPKKMKAGVID